MIKIKILEVLLGLTKKVDVADFFDTCIKKLTKINIIII